MRQLILIILFILAAGTPGASAAASEVSAKSRAEGGESLSLQQAVERALNKSPRLAAATQALSAAGARVEQAGLMPNP